MKRSESWAVDWLPITEQPPTNNWVKGWACITGPNIRDKKSERIFINKNNSQPVNLTGDLKDKVLLLWKNLVDNYKKEHKRDINKRKENKHHPSDYLGDSPGKTAWSRHIYCEDSAVVGSTILCYLECDFQSKNKDVTAVYPVSISRRLYDVSPESLLGPSLKPASEYEKLSPADRVFGWVNQSQSRGQAAYKGNIRISRAICCSSNPLEFFDRNGKNGLPLSILAQPKPQQARFYVAKSSKRCEKQDDRLQKTTAGYSNTEPAKGLRGRKVYPHHAGTLLSKNYWDNPLEDRTQQGSEIDFGTHFQEYRRPQKGHPENKVWLSPKNDAVSFYTEKGVEQLDDQNRSIKSWVMRGVRFTFNIDISNLSDYELGALIWILSLNVGQQDPKYFHRLGGGKPLGFGSVVLEIDWGGTKLCKGSDLSRSYESFENDCYLNVIEDRGSSLINQFKKSTLHGYEANSFENISFISAYLACSKGFNAPIHYPRARPNPSAWKMNAALPPHPEGRSFEWFVQNEDVSLRKAYSLPDLSCENDAMLPVLNIEPVDKSKNNKNRNKHPRNR